MRRTLAAACVALATTGGVFASAPAAHAQPIFCVVATVYDPITRQETTTSPFCIQSQPWNAWCSTVHPTLLGSNPNDPNDPTAFHAWVAFCVMTP